MNATSIHIKIEEHIKDQAQKTADELGLSLSAVVKALLKQFIRTKQLSVGIHEIPNDYLLHSLKQSDEDIKKGRVSPSFDNAKDAIAWLHNPKRKYQNEN